MHALKKRLGTPGKLKIFWGNSAPCSALLLGSFTNTIVHNISLRKNHSDPSLAICSMRVIVSSHLVHQFAAKQCNQRCYEV